MLASLLLWSAMVVPTADPLAAGFANPPFSARPHTWWHWMNGNVTREGITADLEAMREVGIGGAQMFTVDQNIPAGPAGYAGPLWRELTTHAIREAGRLGIELCIHNCAGWSSSGGPWIKPSDAMQVLAWSETTVEGPRSFSEVLPKPKAPQVVSAVDYYRDIAVYAFPTPENPASKPGDFLARTGVTRGDGLEPVLGSQMGVSRSDIKVLSTNLSGDGRLEWEVPAGKWTILRMGHVPTGKDNHPAPPEGDGLEVDKLSKEALDQHWEGLMAKVIADAGPLAGKVLNNSLIDSYEVGSQNWTPKFREEFRKRRGYDCLPYMPAIAGINVSDKATTERFLWDFRRTIADLFAENYFGYFGQKCHQAGLKFSVEPYGNGGFDNIQAGSKADIPMGEFWIPGWSMESVKLAASVGHVYGKQIVGAESFTADEGSGRWLEEPFNMKAVGDRAFTNGLNRVIFHRYAMQPWVDVKPGMTMGPWGTHLDRTQTWWTEAKEWLRYLSRCQYLLQQGKFVADVCYFYGEGAPVDLPAKQNLKPGMPDGYDYDGADVQALMSMQVVNGRLQLPSGMSYRLLVLPQSTFITSRVGAKIRDLVAAGATVLGPKPLNTPSLGDLAEGQQKLTNIADQVWGTGQQGPHTYQKGRVFVGVGIEQALQAMHITPDFQPVGSRKNLLYIHRRIGSDDVYFVSNQNYRPTSAEVAFRVGNRTPELWHPDSGKTEFAPSYRTGNGSTTLDLTLGPAESLFVVFRRSAASSHFNSVQVSDSSEGMKSPKLEILKAFYGSADGRGRDVTKDVRSMVADGQTAISANNASFGDPVLNVVKQITIDYRLNGKELKIQVPENAQAVLLPMPPVTAPRYKLTGLSNGNVEAVLWRQGVIKFATVGSAGQGFKSDRNPLQLDLSQNWKVQFAPNLGAPKEMNFAKLISWPDHPNPGIRYFSGSATYSKEFTLPNTWKRSQSAVRLDLGTVKNFATVTLNGKSLPPLWKPPFVADVTNLVHPGLNRLSIKITNLWANRLIGDEQLPPEADFNGNHMDRWPAWLKPGKAKIASDRPKTGRITFATWKYFDKNSPLQPSGLLGPVRLESAPVILLKPH